MTVISLIGGGASDGGAGVRTRFEHVCPLCSVIFITLSGVESGLNPRQTTWPLVTALFASLASHGEVCGKCAGARFLPWTTSVIPGKSIHSLNLSFPYHQMGLGLILDCCWLWNLEDHSGRVLSSWGWLLPHLAAPISSWEKPKEEWMSAVLISAFDSVRLWVLCW